MRRWRRQRRVLPRRRKLLRGQRRWSIHHALRRALFEQRRVKHSEWATNKTDDRRQRRQQLRKIRRRETRNGAENRNDHRARQQQNRSLFHALASRRDLHRLVRRAVNRHHAAARQQMNDAIERETTTGTKPHCSRNLLLTALRTIHEIVPRQWTLYDTLDNTCCSLYWKNVL